MDIQQLAEQLHQEGIEKGKVDAQKILEKAEQEAKEIIANAEKKASEMIANAEKKISDYEENSKQNLQLALRDITLSIQQNMSEILQKIATVETKKELNNADFMKELILDTTKSLNTDMLELSPKLQEKLGSWIKEQLNIDIKTNSHLVGFALQVKDGGFLEITPDAVLEVLLPYLNQELRNLIQPK